MTSETIHIGDKVYRIAETRGGEPSVYRASSFTAVGAPVTVAAPAGISYTQSGTFIIAVLEEVQ